MIARYTLPTTVQDNENMPVQATLRTANDYIRSIQADATKSMCSCVDGVQNIVQSAQHIPTKAQLQQLVDVAVADQWVQDVQKMRADGISTLHQQALGPFQQICRVARDLRNSAATRRQRIEQALYGQLKKAKANTQDITDIPGLSVMKGCFL